MSNQPTTPPLSTIKPATEVLLAKGYQFTQDWFTSRSPQWHQYVAPVVKDVPARCLEIGSYEGLSAVWLVNEFFTHDKAHLTCVDPWPSNGILARYEHNILVTGKKEQITRYRDTAFNVLRKMDETLDFVYIDGDHQAKSALTDLALVWPLLRSGGVVCLDDYPWVFPKEEDRLTKLPPKPGIDAFLELWKGEYELLHKAWQVFLRKK